MKVRTIVWICVAVAPVAILAQGPASPSKGGAKLMGVISDSVFGSPLVGAGVKVLEDNTFKFVKSTLTEPPFGTYEVDDLTAGKKYWVLFCKETYSTWVSTVTVPTKVDVRLTKRKADQVYWKEKAEKVIADFNVTGRADKVSFEKTWEDFQASPVSAAGKAYVARDLKDQLHANPELWASVKPFRAYADADPAKLDDVEGAIWMNTNPELWVSGKPFTAYADPDPAKLDEVQQAIWLNTNDPAVFSLDPIILRDMVTRKAEVQRVVGYKQASPADPCSNPYQ